VPFERLYEVAFPLVWAFAARRAATRAEAEQMTTAILTRAFASQPAPEDEGVWLKRLFAIAQELHAARELPARLRG
jgi:hypothetical protein